MKKAVSVILLCAVLCAALLCGACGSAEKAVRKYTVQQAERALAVGEDERFREPPPALLRASDEPAEDDGFFVRGDVFDRRELVLAAAVAVVEFGQDGDDLRVAVVVGVGVQQVVLEVDVGVSLLPRHVPVPGLVPLRQREVQAAFVHVGPDDAQQVVHVAGRKRQANLIVNRLKEFVNRLLIQILYTRFLHPEQPEFPKVLL